ncbi:MAG: enoyl-CoA hydratase/isomerase family protein [Pseudomonadales bacterium]|nr:enoyl-CoA hydratase/isomerase family protein [Pseudomonadales bacterium]MCP5183886.1 enoyl-CoA hydratase/isomerase family protein [Pseudomonadales bacterium]
MPLFVSPTPQLTTDLREGVAVVTLNRPEARNALTDELSGALRQAIAWVREDSDVGALLLTGAGTAFCSGADVKAMGNRTADAPPPSLESQFRQMRARHREIAGELTALRKPTVAALPGPAAGAGMAIALCCDLRVAADTAFLSTAYARIGLSGDYGIAWLLSRIVGPGRARQLLLTGERVTAAQALGIGLINEVAAFEDLPEVAFALAARLAGGPRVAMAYMKDNLDEALGIDHLTAIDREADRLLKARSTADHREAVRAFAEKREPRFRGE